MLRNPSRSCGRHRFPRDINRELEQNSGFGRCILQAQLNRLLIAGHVVAIAIEHCADKGDPVGISAIRLRETKKLHIHSREDLNSHLVAHAEEPGKQRYRQIVDFGAGVKSFRNGLLLPVRRFRGTLYGKVTATSL